MEFPSLRAAWIMTMRLMSTKKVLILSGLRHANTALWMYDWIYKAGFYPDSPKHEQGEPICLQESVQTWSQNAEVKTSPLSLSPMILFSHHG